MIPFEPLSDQEFEESGLPESFRGFTFWDEEGYLLTIACHKKALEGLKPFPSPSVPFDFDPMGPVHTSFKYDQP